MRTHRLALLATTAALVADVEVETASAHLAVRFTTSADGHRRHGSFRFKLAD